MHTPGPWTAVANEWDEVLSEKDRGKEWYILAPNEDVIGTGLGLSEPDARLIAAAPDLLAALKALTLAAACETLPLDWGVRVKQARDAIAKAEGVS